MWRCLFLMKSVQMWLLWQNRRVRRFSILYLCRQKRKKTGFCHGPLLFISIRVNMKQRYSRSSYVRYYLLPVPQEKVRELCCLTGIWQIMRSVLIWRFQRVPLPWHYFRLIMCIAWLWILSKEFILEWLAASMIQLCMFKKTSSFLSRIWCCWCRW